jgi:organic hydroperoxide reductase OsmC/OhrA
VNDDPRVATAATHVPAAAGDEVGSAVTGDVAAAAGNGVAKPAAGAGPDADFTVELVQQSGYRFEVHFDNPAVPVLLTDEAPPLGDDAGPNPSRLLAVSVANCLAASLLFSLRKFGNEPGPLRARATARLMRNEARRLRVAGIAVELHLGVAAGELKRLDRALAQFEDFCIVTQSVRAAFPVDVRVFDRTGERLGD